MRTTLQIDDELFRLLKERAAKEGTTASGLVERALRALLLTREPEKAPYKLAWKTVEGRLLPGVDLADRDSLYERMDGRT